MLEKPETFYRNMLNGFLMIAVVSVSGCLTLPVKGEYREVTEKFLGSATGYMNGNGDISIVSENGTKCEGNFRYINGQVNGEGGFKCSDGRIGDFFFTSSGTEGEGFGRDNYGKLFSFKFGGPEYTARAQAQWYAIANQFDSMARSYRPTTSYCTQFGNSYRCTHYGY